jgi:hypothetical protein
VAARPDLVTPRRMLIALIVLNELRGLVVVGLVLLGLVHG